MNKFLMRLFGRHIASAAVQHHTSAGGILDVRFGFSLLKDRRIPVTAKMTALVAGVVVTGMLLLLELPLEAFIAVLLPVVGFVPDAIVDGLEVVAGPLLVSALLLPHLAPRAIVEEIRSQTVGVVGR